MPGTDNCMTFSTYSISGDSMWCWRKDKQLLCANFTRKTFCEPETNQCEKMEKGSNNFVWTCDKITFPENFQLFRVVILYFSHLIVR